MAIAKNGILGGFSGSVGDIIGATWKGKTTIRSKSAIEKKPLTQKQKDALLTSKLVLDFWKESKDMYPWIDLSSKELGMTPMNVFQRKYRTYVLWTAASFRPFPPFNHNPKDILAYEWNAPYPGTSTLTFDGEFSQLMMDNYSTAKVDITIFQFRPIGNSAKLVEVWRKLGTPVSDDGAWFSYSFTAENHDRWCVSVMLKDGKTGEVIGTQQFNGFS